MSILAAHLGHLTTPSLRFARVCTAQDVVFFESVIWQENNVQNVQGVRYMMCLSAWKPPITFMTSVA